MFKNLGARYCGFTQDDIENPQQETIREPFVFRDYERGRKLLLATLQDLKDAAQA